MKTINIVFIFLAGLCIGAGGLWLLTHYNMDLRYYLLERPAGNQPQSQVAEFVQSIIDGDLQKSIALWEIQDADTQSELASRRESVVADLAAIGIEPDYLILSIEWWTTCCEPTVTCDSRNAGGARIKVQFLDQHSQPLLYTFDVFAREQPYWGSAAGYPRREWVIRDVYLYDQESLFWTLTFKPQTQSVPSAIP
jgi:hypothetical protein